MKMTDLGQKPDSMACAPAPCDKNKKMYPSLSMYGMETKPPCFDHEGEFDVMVRLKRRSSAVRMNEKDEERYECSFDVISMGEPENTSKPSRSAAESIKEDMEKARSGEYEDEDDES